MIRLTPSTLASALVALGLAAPALAATPVPLVLTSNGYLLDPSDHPVTQTALPLRYSVWSDPDSRVESNRVWPATGESECVADVSNGHFAVVLDGALTSGCGAGFSSAHVPGTAPRYLQISVNGATLLPRMRLASVPNAAHAADADSVGGETPAALHDAAALTGVAPASVLGTGSAGLTTVGTVTTGKWEATPIDDAFLSSATVWNQKLTTVNRDQTLVGDGTAGAPIGANVGTASGSLAAGDDARFGRWTGGAASLDPSAGRTSLGLGTAATTDATAYATAAQGTKADDALPRTGGTLTGAVTFPGTGSWTATGAVGIGTTTPAQGKLVVRNTDSATAITVQTPGTIALKNGDLTNGNFSLLTFNDGQSDTATAAVGTWNTTHSASSTASLGSLALFTKANGASTLTERLRIAPDGNVGVGSTNPAFKLDVAGVARATRLAIGDSSQISANVNDGVGTPEYPYNYTITVAGDAYTYYPVALQAAGNGIPPGKIVIARSYPEAGPVAPAPDASHIAGLQAVFTTNNVAWADYNYLTLQSYRWTYVRTIADCGNLPSATTGRSLWCRLRGGGYVYHLWSNYPLDPAQPASGSVAYDAGGYTFYYPANLPAANLAANAFAPAASIVPVAAY